MNDTAVVTCFFAPCDNLRMRANLEHWRGRLRTQGIEPYVIELAFGDKPFRVDDAYMHLRAEHAIWAKENLINILVEQLPRHFTKVVWSDCDVLWMDDDWLQKTSDALNQHNVVQCFDKVEELDRDGKVSGTAWSTLSKSRPQGGLGVIHRCGIACAARRELFDKWGLYEHCAMGSGDYIHTMVAFLGLRRRRQLEKLYTDEHNFHAKRWTGPVNWWVAEKYGSVDTTVRRLWHGEHENRKYVERYHHLGSYNPETDIVYNKSGVIQWAKPEHANYAQWYFDNRDEDQGLLAAKGITEARVSSTAGDPKLPG